MIHVCPVSREHFEAWFRMRCALWPDEPAEALRAEAAQFLAGSVPHPLAVLIAIRDAAPVGFAELNIRPYAEGCHSGRVAYLEAWYVEPTARRTAVGRALIEAAEAWAGARSCPELASDTFVENGLGTAAHLALGFEEVEIIRCFRKTVRMPGGSET